MVDVEVWVGKRFLGSVVLSLTFICAACSESADSTPPPPATQGGSGGSGGQVTGGTGGGSGSSSVAGGGSGGSTSGGSSGTGGSSGGTAGTGGTGGSGGGMSPGEIAYRDARCVTCHGLIGEGVPTSVDEPMPLGPEIQHPVRPYSEWVVRNGREDTSVGFKHPMFAFGTADDAANANCDAVFEPEGCDMYVSDADLLLIFDYLDTPPQPTTGEGLYLDYCGNCHGADGLGGTTTRALTDAAVLGELVTTTRVGTHPGEEDNRPEHMPPMDETILTDAELQLISDYIDQTFVQ